MNGLVPQEISQIKVHMAYAVRVNVGGIHVQGHRMISWFEAESIFNPSLGLC